jgi:hypothetical protein
MLVVGQLANRGFLCANALGRFQAFRCRGSLIVGKHIAVCINKLVDQ